MNIAVNCRFLITDKIEGIGVYTYETTKRLVLAHPEHHFFLIFDRPFDERFIFGPNCTPVVLSPPARHPWLWYIWFEWRIPAVLRRHKVDAFYSPDSYLSTRSSVPTTLIVHDLAYLHYPKSIPRIVYRYYTRWFPKFMSKSKNIGAVSHATAEDINAQYANLPIAEKINYTPCAAGDIFRPHGAKTDQETRDQITDGDEYFLYVGAIHPRKNIVNLLKAFHIFKKFYRSSYKLILVGRIAWMSNEFEKYMAQHPYRQDIIHLDGISTEELAKIYSAAYLFIYPSLFEGFGMPILESLKSGIPAITSDRSSMPEVLGDAGLLVDPDNPQDIADRMGELYKNETLYQHCKRASQVQAAKFSWDQTTETIWGMINEKEN